MNPTSMQHEIARYRQVDMLREAQRARLAHEASVASDQTRRRFRFWRRKQTPALGRPAVSR